MPRFFFHVVDDVVIRDDEGIELSDAEAARSAALAGARAMICDQVKTGRIALHHRIDVEDEAGQPVLTMTFGDAVTIEA
ncbi:MAG TPA: hypothetical protein VFQ67_09380 [Allosphingosinicella sp.]|nr:hypothetical protein [Allosphingosinicella sp.]